MSITSRFGLSSAKYLSTQINLSQFGNKIVQAVEGQDDKISTAVGFGAIGGYFGTMVGLFSTKNHDPDGQRKNGFLKNSALGAGIGSVYGVIIYNFIKSYPKTLFGSCVFGVAMIAKDTLFSEKHTKKQVKS